MATRSKTTRIAPPDEAAPKRQTFVFKRGSKFIYRRDIPLRWRRHFGKRVWFETIDAATAEEALSRAYALAQGHTEMLKRLDAFGPTQAIKEQIQIIESTTRESLAALRRRRFTIADDDPAALRRLNADIRAVAAPAEKKLDSLRTDLINAAEDNIESLPIHEERRIEDLGGVRSALDKFETYRSLHRLLAFAWKGGEPDPNLIPSPPSNMTEEEEVMFLGRIAFEAKREQKDRVGILARAQEARKDAEDAREALAPTGILGEEDKIPPMRAHDGAVLSLSQQYAIWMERKKRRPETARKWDVYMRRLIEVHGDISVRSVTKKMIVSYYDTICQLPDSRGLKPELRKGTVQELLAWKDSENKRLNAAFKADHARRRAAGEASSDVAPPQVPLLSPATASKHLDCVRAFFKWVTGRDDDDAVSPVRNVKAEKNEKEEHEEIRSFTHDEMQQIVAMAKTQWGADSDRYWLLLLAIYTGARREELAQLARKNLYPVGEDWFIDINGADGRKLKNKPSKRLVPIHPALIDMGFLAHVKKGERQEEGKGEGEVLLFPSMTMTNGQYGHKLGAAFSRLLREKVGITDPTVHWHSFRHSFSTACREGGVAQDIRYALMGHSERNRSAGTYGEPPPPEQLAGAIRLLKLPSFVGVESVMLSPQGTTGMIT